MTLKPPVRIAVTGAAGQIAYATLFRIAGGIMLGRDQPVILQLLDLPQAQQALRGVIMEMQDCAFPLLADIFATDDPEVAFKDADIALLIGARPRTQGMERADLLHANAEIFKVQGAALNKVAHRNVKVLVVGNPANTNAYIAMKSAPDIPPENFTALMRLDHHRAVSQIAEKINRPITSIEQMCVWGNHSPTMYADYRYATSNGESVQDMITEHRRTRCRHYRRTRLIIRSLRRQCRHLPPARLAARQQRQMGNNGRSVGRLLRHSRRFGFRLPRHLRRRQLPHRPRLRLVGRIQPKPYCRHAGRIRRRAFSHPGSTLKQRPSENQISEGLKN